MAYTLIKLGSSTDGRGIKVTQTATAGTQIHLADSGVTFFDRVFLWAYNAHTANVLLSLEWGGVTAPDDIRGMIIPVTTTLLVAPGWILRNSLNIKAFAGTANVISISGYALRKS